VSKKMTSQAFQYRKDINTRCFSRLRCEQLHGGIVGADKAKQG
jgi:hypothetical protein